MKLEKDTDKGKMKELDESRPKRSRKTDWDKNLTQKCVVSGSGVVRCRYYIVE